MEFIFADDAKQLKPSRALTGPLVAVGGLCVGGDVVGDIERGVAAVCARFGIGSGQRFKWSPGRGEEDAVFRRMQHEDRVQFYQEVLSLAASCGARGIVAVCDASKGFASKVATDSEHDVTTLFLERVNWHLGSKSNDGLVVIASPDGGNRGATEFLAKCFSLIESGTEYAKFKRLPLRVVLTKSSDMRLLQVADVIVSCTTALIAGEEKFSPEVFQYVHPILRRDGSRIGGVGVKIHPDFTYANLYHWLLGDSHFWKGNSGLPLPIASRPFATPPNGTATVQLP